VSKRISLAIALAVALPTLFVALSAAPASAHELKKDGAYDLLVGFGVEPAYLGQPNFVQIFVHDLHGNAIQNIDTLKVTVEAQGKSMNLAVEPSFDPDSGLGTKGEYDADFFPTALGKYTFHLTGTIKGQKIDESFTSGPDTFSEVEDPVTVQFPNKVPTLEAVSTRLVQESQRTSQQVDAAQASADSAASSAKTIAWVGVIVGALGLITAIVALTRRRA
jgi:hypothetical protein